ncbi:MAG: LysR family transcriptional regulator [Myxococcales bacterium]|nr:LysR family transcriptional regulator [Myxococcales bacterium]
MGTHSRPKGRQVRGTAVPRGRERTGYRVVGRVWIEKDGEAYLGWGRVVLLERIREYGSILAASKSMEMGYRHAWKLVEDMNRLAPRPLVHREAGGASGGGTQLTAEGERAIADFWKTVEGFGRWLDGAQATRSPGRRRGAR